MATAGEIAGEHERNAINHESSVLSSATTFHGPGASGVRVSHRRWRQDGVFGVTEMTEKTARCETCGKPTRFLLHQQLFANGSNHFVWVCSVCDVRNPSRDKTFFIPHSIIQKYLTSDQIAALPVLLPDFANRCVRCGRRECELHHWAPEHLFDDFNDWPKDFLCPDCHNLWHSVVTPEMGGSNGPQ